MGLFHLICFNRTTVELKRIYSEYDIKNTISFNRTTVELKPEIGTASPGNGASFNRTTVELKRVQLPPTRHLS